LLKGNIQCGRLIRGDVDPATSRLEAERCDDHFVVTGRDTPKSVIAALVGNRDAGRTLDGDARTNDHTSRAGDGALNCAKALLPMYG
jgi:hypothetical protein